MEEKLSENAGFIQYLEQFLTANKLEKINSILPYRTRYFNLVLEDIYQPHNASAVLRTAECFGIQDIHIIENRNQYRLNPDVALGASKWIDMHRYREAHRNNTLSCIHHLKESGYRIVATSPHERGYALEELPLDSKFALVFGTELEGISDSIVDLADEFVMIPMYGFTESLNISVSAALFTHYLSSKIRSSDIEWKLTAKEEKELRLKWYKNCIKNSDLHEKEYKRLANKEQE